MSFPGLGQFTHKHVLTSTQPRTWAGPFADPRALCTALSSLVCYPSNSSFFLFPRPQLHILNSWRLSPGTRLTPLCDMAWKFSPGIKLRLSWGLPHLLSPSQVLLSCSPVLLQVQTWESLFCILWFFFSSFLWKHKLGRCYSILAKQEYFISKV